MTRISAEVIADSITEQGHRLTTMKLVFPRYILAELNTHRMFSRNSASSRAIPFEKMVKAVQDDPFVPIAWQRDHKGMQGTEYITDETQLRLNTDAWLNARDNAVSSASYLNHAVHAKGDVSKQLCNRLLEPFMWHTVLVSATEWENFFALRCPDYYIAGDKASSAGDPKVLSYRSKKDCIEDIGMPDRGEDPMFWLEVNRGQAEIHMMALAEAMWDARNESEPKKLGAGEWHIPFGDQIDQDVLDSYAQNHRGIPEDFHHYSSGMRVMKKDRVAGLRVKIATARCARISYTTVGNESEHTYEQDIKLHDRLLASGHMSPFEHCARAMTEAERWYWTRQSGLGLMGVDEKNFIHENQGWCGNFRGFVQYRKMIPGENRTS